MNSNRYIHIVGKKNHGKTTLVVELVEALTARGLQVGTIKHCGHRHLLDTPGKDSYRHRGGGSEPTAVITPDTVVVHLRREPTTNPFKMLEPLFSGCDLVICEGAIDGPGTKIEVWQAERGTSPLSADNDEIVAIVSDDRPEVSVPVLPRADITALVERIRRLVPGT